MRLIKLFPEAAFLIEKPISIASMEEVEQVREALKGRVVSVGYMLRYLKGMFQVNSLYGMQSTNPIQPHSRSSEPSLARHTAASLINSDDICKKTTSLSW